MTIKRIRGLTNQQRRKRLFEREPLCRLCAAQGRVRVATIADHVVALVNGGADDETNLAPICADCHRQKTARDLGHRQRQATGADGWPIETGAG